MRQVDERHRGRGGGDDGVGRRRRRRSAVLAVTRVRRRHTVAWSARQPYEHDRRPDETRSRPSGLFVFRQYFENSVNNERSGLLRHTQSIRIRVAFRPRDD